MENNSITFDPELDFTYMAWEHLYDAVDHPYFQDKDAELIYETLEHQMRIVSFGEYLKRYLFRKAHFTHSFEEVSVKEFQTLIVEQFRKHHTPAAFGPTTAKVSAAAKNWLTQKTVKRRVVFLLGFGLAMTLQEVNTFLTNALSEQEINARDPFEVICGYCYQQGESFDKFRELRQKYLDLNPGKTFSFQSEEDRTMILNHQLKQLSKEEQLLERLVQLKAGEQTSSFSRTAKESFLALYNSARRIVADLYNHSEEERLSRDIASYRIRLAGNAHLSDAEKQKRLTSMQTKRVWYQAADITETDLEQVISAAIPRDRHGNLTKVAASRLNEQFAGRCFSRQHIRDVLSGRTEVNRFDLITLNFFIFSQNPEQYSNCKWPYSAADRAAFPGRTGPY